MHQAGERIVIQSERRPNIRIHAEDFRRVDTVSGDIVHTADITWYRNGQQVFPNLREVLRVDRSAS